MDWTTILTSAAIGAISGQLVQLFGQAIERKHRERELIFKFSVEAAKAQREIMHKYAKEESQIVAIPDELYLAADYYPFVGDLLRYGKHPRETRPENHRQWVPPPEHP